MTDDDIDSVADFFHAIGRQIKLLREQAGLTQKQLAYRVGYSEEQISSIEIGRRTPRPELLEVLDDLLVANGLLKAVIPDVVKAKERPRLRHPDWFQLYARLEAEAAEVHQFSAVAIPGLFQTEAYARAVFANRQPLLDSETQELRVAARLGRQEILTRWPPPTVTMVIWEPVLRQPIGGREVLAGQLERLLEIGSLRNVELQVIPAQCEGHAGLSGPFTLLSFKGRRRLGYLEVQHISRLIEDPEEVRILAGKYGSIRAEALTPRDSLAMIKAILGAL